MDDNKPGDDAGKAAGDLGLTPASGQRKRAAPTIDLTASDVSEISSAPENAGPEQDGQPQASADPIDSVAAPSRTAALFVSALTGALAAALIVGAVWWAGWPFASADDSAAAQKETAVAALTARVAKVETRISQPAAPQTTAVDPALATRVTSIETALSSLRADVAALRAQGDKAAAEMSAIKSADRAAAPAADLSTIEERLGKIERATATLAAVPSPPAAPPEDPKLQRVAAASALAQAVRKGEPFAAPLAAVAKFSGDVSALKPLDAFAATGVPGVAALSRELLTILPRLTPKQDSTPLSGGILDRLQQSAMRLVHIKRVDAAGSDLPAVVARATAAAQRNDVAEARRELMALAQSDRAPVQPWLDKVDARDAALTASQKFAEETIATLPASPASATPR